MFAKTCNMNDKGNKYALAALKDKRGSIASEIVHTERKLRHLRQALTHVDASLRLLDPSIDTGKIPKKRLIPGRIRLFRQGELGRLIRDAMRTANGNSITTTEIVAHVVAAGGHGDSARAAVAPRVRGNLAYLKRRGVIEKTGNLGNTRWQLSYE